MFTEVVTIEYLYQRGEEIADLVIAVAEHIKAHGQGQPVEITRNVSGVGNELHLVLKYESISDYGQKRKARQADAELQRLLLAIAEIIHRSSHHFYEEVWSK